MEEQRLTYLMERYLADQATAEELQELGNTLKADVSSDLFKTVLAEMMHREAPAFPENRERWQQMALDIVRVDKARVVRIWKWAGAAAVILLTVAGGYLLTSRAPRSLIADAGAPVRDSVVSTARGEQREVILPDGSHVWLNSASTIRWSVPFNDQERSVELSGEAFINVQHADKIPFLIHSGDVTTTVLGTAFDVMAYPHQRSVTVAVESGKVKVQAGTRVLAVLEKGRQLRIDADTTPYQKNVDVSTIAVWRAGNLVYKDERLEDIVADLQRAFDDSIEIKTSSLNKMMITISIDKKTGLQKALEMVCRITDSRLSNRSGVFTIE